MRVTKDELLLTKMKQGQVYRRADLVHFTSTLDRYLDRLVKKHKLLKVAPGLYMRPNRSAFGFVPADDHTLVKIFLKDDRFLVNSYNNYNQLGLGLTQLYQNKVVYNYKRFGEFELGGKKFFFKRIPKFPKILTKEFLLVDLLNNLKDLAEDEEQVIQNLKSQKKTFDSKKVLAVAAEYGRPKTKKILEEVYK